MYIVSLYFIPVSFAEPSQELGFWEADWEPGAWGPPRASGAIRSQGEQQAWVHRSPGSRMTQKPPGAVRAAWSHWSWQALGWVGGLSSGSPQGTTLGKEDQPGAGTSWLWGVQWSWGSFHCLPVEGRISPSWAARPWSTDDGDRWFYYSYPLEAPFNLLSFLCFTQLQHLTWNPWLWGS